MIKCLAVDDEALSLDLLEDNIKRIPFLHLVQRCKNAYEAMDVLRREPIDLIFLDIQMPGVTGTQFLQSLTHKPVVIFITAFKKYALEGFELDVLDYLVKPISFERFLKSISKYHQYNVLKQPAASENNDEAFEKAYMYFKVNKDLVKIFLKEIIYIESIKDYVKIITTGRSVITYQRIGFMEEKLPENKFVHIHKSYIIAVDKIVSYNNEDVNVQSFSLPIGRNYKQQFLKLVE